jgi:hypothetical protein
MFFVVCTLHLILESFYSFKIPYEFWNIMFYYSSFCLQRLPQFVWTTSWVVIVIMFTNLLPKCVAFLAISYDWTLQDVEKWTKNKTFLLEEKNLPLLLGCWSFKCLCCYHGSYSQNSLTYPQKNNDLASSNSIIVYWCIGSYKMILIFLNFVLLLKWQSSINIFNQIWNIQNTKSYAPFHILNNCDDFWSN